MQEAKRGVLLERVLGYTMVHVFVNVDSYSRRRRVLAWRSGPRKMEINSSGCTTHNDSFADCGLHWQTNLESVRAKDRLLPNGPVARPRPFGEAPNFKANSMLILCAAGQCALAFGNMATGASEDGNVAIVPTLDSYFCISGL